MAGRPKSSAFATLAVIAGTVLLVLAGGALLDSGISERSSMREEKSSAPADAPGNQHERLAASGRHSDSAFDTSFNSQSDSEQKIISAGTSENKNSLAENSAEHQTSENTADNTVSDVRPRRLTPEIYIDRRIQLNPNDTVEIVLPKHLLNSTLPVTIRSEDGGVVDGRDLTPEMTFEAGHIPEAFRYTVGRHRGLYVVSIYYGQEIQRLEFWAGEPLPQGMPGPSRNIVPPEVK